MAGIVADEAEIIRAAPSVLERHFGNHSDPVLVSAPEVASLEAKIAKTVIDWSPLIELDRQGIVRPVTHDDIGAGVDGCAADLGHILQWLASKAPMAGGNQGVDLVAQPAAVLAEA